MDKGVRDGFGGRGFTQLLNTRTNCSCQLAGLFAHRRRFTRLQNPICQSGIRDDVRSWSLRARWRPLGSPIRSRCGQRRACNARASHRGESRRPCDNAAVSGRPQRVALRRRAQAVDRGERATRSGPMPTGF